MDNHEIQVSIVVPVYKIQGEYIEQCVETLMKQSFQSIEVILVDDGTPDDGGAVCDKLSTKYSNCKVIHQENQGVSHARNNGFSMAAGQWIMFVDPDDYTEPELIETLLKECDDETDVVCCCCKVVKSNATTDIDHFFEGNKTFRSIEEKRELFQQLMLPEFGQPGNVYTAIGVPWGKLYRRELFEKYQLRFDSSLRRMQDNIFNMHVFYAARTVKYIDQPLYVYRYEHIAGFQMKYNKDNMQNHLNIIRKRNEFFRENGLLEDEILYHTSLQEAFIEVKVILRYGPFHPDFNGERVKTAEEIMTQEEIAEIMRKIKSEKVLSSLSERILYLLISNRCWILLQLLWRMK